MCLFNIQHTFSLSMYYVYNDRFVRVRVQLKEYPGIPTEAESDLNPEDNVIYKHIYIHCPGK